MRERQLSHFCGSLCSLTKGRGILYILRTVSWQKEDFENSILAKWRFGALAWSPNISKDVKFPFSWNPGFHGSPNLPFYGNYKSESLEAFFFHRKSERLLAICFTCGGRVVGKAVTLGKIDIFRYTLSSIIVKVRKWLMILTHTYRQLEARWTFTSDFGKIAFSSVLIFKNIITWTLAVTEFNLKQFFLFVFYNWMSHLTLFRTVSSFYRSSFLLSCVEILSVAFVCLRRG